LPPPLFSQQFRTRTAYTSQASLNIFWYQILFELFVARLHFRLPDFYFAQLHTEISGDFLSAGLRQCSYCKETTQQQSGRNPIHKSFHFHTPSAIFSPYNLIRLPGGSKMPETITNTKTLPQLSLVAVLDELFEKEADRRRSVRLGLLNL
jgi:hypothetical protein